MAFVNKKGSYFSIVQSHVRKPKTETRKFVKKKFNNVLEKKVTYVYYFIH